jgi:thioredoxin reductase
MYGRVRLRRVRKERLLALWQSVIGKTGIEIHHGVRVDGVSRLEHGFEVTTSAGVARTGAVLLATGRRGAPRRLGVPGEELPKVAYRLGDAAHYDGRHVLVVGGGDSALEAAIALARRPVGSVTLAYRGTAFDRAAPAHRLQIDRLEREGRVHVLRSAHVRRIDARSVIVELPARTVKIANDDVIICAGGSLPTALLTDIGIRVERKFGTA